MRMCIQIYTSCSHTVSSVSTSTFEPELWIFIYFHTFSAIFSTLFAYGLNLLQPRSSMVDLDEKRVQAGGLDCKIFVEVGIDLWIRCVVFFCMKRFLNVIYLYKYWYVCDSVIRLWFGSDLPEMLYWMSYSLDNSLYFSFSIRLNLWNVPSIQQYHGALWHFVWSDLAMNYGLEETRGGKQHGQSNRSPRGKHMTIRMGETT